MCSLSLPKNDSKFKYQYLFQDQSDSVKVKGSASRFDGTGLKSQGRCLSTVQLSHSQANQSQPLADKRVMTSF